MSAPRRPPPPIPRPGQVQVVRAVYNYTAQQPDEISFDEGDILYIIDRSAGPWWKAKVGNKTGLIPSNYVAEHTEAVENPLHEAAKRGNMGFLNECLQNKVSVNGLDKSGSTPLHWAAQGGHTECVKVLLGQPRIQISVQPDLCARPSRDMSCEIRNFVIPGTGRSSKTVVAIFKKVDNQFSIMTKFGKLISMESMLHLYKNKLGDTPLHSASWKSHPDIVELLLQKGARTDVRNNAQQTPIDLARDPECGRLLRGAVALGGDDYGEEEDSD